MTDLSGGGSVQAAEFVPGPGGSTDAFKGAANGAFAVVPLSQLNTGYAATDAHTASLVDANGKAVSTPIGQTITFGDGGPVPAGTYAVLPARYALLNGAFLVAPSSFPLHSPPEMSETRITFGTVEGKQNDRRTDRARTHPSTDRG